MGRIVWRCCILACCVVGALATGSGANPRPATATATAPATAPATEPTTKAGPTELVAAFYRALVQDDPPTLEQEHALFNIEISGLRTNLIARGLGTDKDPVLLNLFRQNKDRFLPRNMKSLKEIGISSPFTFTRNVEELKEGNKIDNGYVMVTFVADRKTHLGIRTLIFSFQSGRIDPDAIYLDNDGFSGKATLEMYLKIDGLLKPAE